MATTVDIRDLPERFAELLDLARTGAEVVVTDGTTPQARLVPLATPGPRIPGLHAGLVDIAPDFDDPLPDEFWGGRVSRHYSTPIPSSGGTADPHDSRREPSRRSETRRPCSS